VIEDFNKTRGYFVNGSKLKFLLFVGVVRLTQLYFSAEFERAVFSYILSYVYCEFHNKQKHRTKGLCKILYRKWNFVFESLKMLQKV
jgi:hypothetical protein